MKHGLQRAKLSSLLAGARRGEGLGTEELRFLLELTEQEDLERLFETARDLRRDVFGTGVFLYGFVYFSTYCRNDCRFCLFRRSNHGKPRYRKPAEEVLKTASGLAASGVHLVDLTLGEDPGVLGRGGKGAEALAELASQVKKSVNGLPLMLSPGLVGEAALRRYAAAGVDWYACYQETHDRRLFAELRPGQSFEARWQAKRAARRMGFLVEEGILCGVGEGPAQLARSIDRMRALDADQVRVMSFVPQPGTPMADHPAPDFRRELKILATLRLAFPDRLVPASLDVEGLDGLKRRLDAGANVVTSLIAPDSGMEGVAGACRDVGNGRRTAAAVLPVLSACGLEPASRAVYLEWIEGRRRIAGRLPEDGVRCA